MEREESSAERASENDGCEPFARFLQIGFTFGMTDQITSEAKFSIFLFFSFVFPLLWWFLSLHE